MVLSNKASNEQLQALHGDLASIYLSQLKKLKYEDGFCVFIPFNIADALRELSRMPVEALTEEDLIPIKDLTMIGFKGLSRDDISLLKNIQTFLKENSVEADASKRPTARSLRGRIKAEIES